MHRQQHGRLPQSRQKAKHLLNTQCSANFKAQLSQILQDLLQVHTGAVPCICKSLTRTLHVSPDMLEQKLQNRHDSLSWFGCSHTPRLHDSIVLPSKLIHAPTIAIHTRHLQSLQAWTLGDERQWASGTPCCAGAAMPLIKIRPQQVLYGSKVNRNHQALGHGPDGSNYSAVLARSHNNPVFAPAGIICIEAILHRPGLHRHGHLVILGRSRSACLQHSWHNAAIHESSGWRDLVLPYAVDKTFWYAEAQQTCRAAFETSPPPHERKDGVEPPPLA